MADKNSIFRQNLGLKFEVNTVYFEKYEDYGILSIF